MKFGQGTISIPSAYGPAADSDLIQPEFWAIPPDGDAFVLSEAGDFDLSDIAGSRGAFTVTLPLRTATHDLLYANTVVADRDLEVEIRLFGGANQALRGLLQECDGDDIAESGTRKWSGCLMDGLLYESLLPPNTADPKGEWHFAGKNPGQIVATLVLDAKARGELPGVTIATFSPAADSFGTSWAGYATTVTIPPGKSLGEILDDFLERGLVERQMTGLRELKLFVPGTRGVDRTVGPDPIVLHRGRDLTDAPRKWSVRDAATDILVAGKEGLYQTATDASARARRGRKIVKYASDNDVVDAAALQAYAQNKLATLTPGAVELSHGLVVNGWIPLPSSSLPAEASLYPSDELYPSDDLAPYDTTYAATVVNPTIAGTRNPQPFLDVNVGDWVWSDTGSPAGPERLRVQQVSLSRSGDELKAVAVVGTLSMSAVVMLARRLARLESGTTVVGTSVDPATGGAGDDVIPPAAPTGLVASSIAYQDVANGETLARIDLGWQAVTTDAREAVAAQAQAAQLILDRIESGAPILDTWTWVGAPALVTTYAASLVSAFNAAHSGDTPPVTTTDLPAAKTWLQAFILDAEQAVSDPVVTDDVAGYRVRYAYVGANQIGGIPSSDPFLDENTLVYYMATDDTGTTATTFSWGGVGAGREVRLQVQAFDRSGNSSTWSAPLVITTAVDNLPPAAPSTPTLEVLFSGVRIIWDGLTTDAISARTADPDFDHVEVHLSPALDFTPDTTTYQDILNDFGVWTVQGLEYGVGYYARLVSVDTAGNKSAPSASGGPATPGKLVNIDIGPDAITRVQIVDGEIVTAKIADLAVNDAKIASLSVGKLTAGVMTADVVIGGSFMTALTGQRMRTDSSGWQGYNSLNQVFAKLDIPNQTMLMTGTYQSGLTGERINILPDGTLRFYPSAGTNYSSMNNFGNDVVWRGPLDAAGRSGRFNVNVLGCGMNFSAESEIPNNLRSEVVCFDRQVFTTAPNIFFRVNQKLSPLGGFPGYRAATFAFTTTNGVDMLGGSAVHYRMGSSGSGGWSNNGAGLKFEGNYVLITDETLNSFGPIKASDFAPPSSRELKELIVDLADAVGCRLVEVARRLRPVEFQYRAGVEQGQPRHAGLIVEEVSEVAPTLVSGRDQPTAQQALSVMGLATLGVGAAADNAEDIDHLRARVAALEARLAA